MPNSGSILKAGTTKSSATSARVTIDTSSAQAGNVKPQASFITALDPAGPDSANSGIAAESSITSDDNRPLSPIAHYDAGHEFAKGIEEATQLEQQRNEEELEELRHHVYHAEWVAQLAKEKAEREAAELARIRSSVVRPATVHDARQRTQEELSSADLALPRGLNFRHVLKKTAGAEAPTSAPGPNGKAAAKKGGVAGAAAAIAKKAALQAERAVLPRDLLEASETMASAEKSKSNFGAIGKMTTDLEVLLGNKSASGAHKVDLLTEHLTKKSDGKEISAVQKGTLKSYVKDIQDGNVNILAAERGIDLGPKGKRFGGGITGMPIKPRHGNAVVDASNNNNTTATQKDEAASLVQELKKMQAESLASKPGSPQGPLSMPLISEEDFTAGSSGGGGDNLDVKTRLLGLPGHLSLNLKQTESYFGEQARVNFHDRYHWLGAQRKITNYNNVVMSVNSGGQMVQAGTTRSLMYEQGSSFGQEYAPEQVPFAPNRPSERHITQGTSDLAKVNGNISGSASVSSFLPAMSGGGRTAAGASLASYGASTATQNKSSAKTGTAANATGKGKSNSSVTAAAAAASVDKIHERGGSKAGRGGLFSRDGPGAGADTYRSSVKPAPQFGTLGNSTMPSAASTGSGLPTNTRLTLPFMDEAGHSASATNAVPAPSHFANIMSDSEQANAYGVGAFQKALKGGHTHTSATATHPQVVLNVTTSEDLARKQKEWDRALGFTDFVTQSIADADADGDGGGEKGKKDLEPFFRGIYKGDYSCLGGGGGSAYRYVSVRAPKYPKVEKEDDEEEEETAYDFLLPATDAKKKKKKKKKKSGLSAKDILDRTEQEDAENMDAEMEAIAFQRRLLIENQAENIPGYDVANSSVNSQTCVDDAGIPLSPRSKFIDACHRDNINPRASLILRKGLTKILDLSHHGIGDKSGRILANCILDLPYLQCIDLTDNNLTDDSLGPLVKAFVQMPHILQVVLSNNVIGDVASHSLSTYLGEATCPLEKLVMRNADVDDFECTRFIQAIKDNASTRLKELDMSQNLLGSAEQLNVVMPEFTTAGEAFAELVESENCRLNRLELGWNMIRGDSAIAFAQAMQSNTSLTYLDLSYNAFGKDGSRELGAALLKNKTLTYLNVAANNIDGSGAFCICVGLIENKTMRELVLDGNPIGALGAKAVMQVPMMIGSRVKIHVSKCNIAIHAETTEGPVFDFENLLRQYHLNLTDSFERAQAFMLLYLIASHHTYNIVQAEHEESKGMSRSLDLVSFLNPDKQEFFTDKQRIIEASLETTIRAASDVNLAIKLFNDIDVDGSGEMDRDEFKSLMVNIGINLDQERLDDVFDTYDSDQGGSIGVDEFLVFLRRQKLETEQRLYDLTQTPAFCEKKDLEYNKKNNVVQETDSGLDFKTADKAMAWKSYAPKRRYIPPSFGVLRLTVEDTFKRKAIYRTVTNSDKDFIEDIASAATDSIAMTTFGVSNSKLRLDEALALYQSMAVESSNKAKILARILPQLSNPGDARLLVTKVLKNDRQDMLALKQTLGVAVRPLLGTVNGYYELDLSVPLDRLCLMRLLELSTARATQLRSAKKNPFSSKGCRAFDISQKKNNGSCFRNEIFKNRPCVIDTKFATPLPRSGILCFDYSGGELPSKDDMLCTDQRVIKILYTAHLMPARYCQAAMVKLDRYAELASLTMGGHGQTCYEAPWERGIEIGNLVSKFYENILDRSRQIEEVKSDKEDILAKVSLSPHAFAPDNSHDDVCIKVMGGMTFIKWSRDPNFGEGSIDRQPDLFSNASLAENSVLSLSGGMNGSLDLPSISSSVDGYRPVNGQELLEDLREQLYGPKPTIAEPEKIPEKWVVRLTNLACAELPNADKGKSSLQHPDPYLMFILGDNKACTRFLPNKNNPAWRKDNYEGELKSKHPVDIRFDREDGTDVIDLVWDPSPTGSMSLMIKVMDHDFHKEDDYIGRVNIDLNDFKKTLESSQPVQARGLKLEKVGNEVSKKVHNSTVSLNMVLLEVSMEDRETGYGCKLPNGTVVLDPDAVRAEGHENAFPDGEEDWDVASEGSGEQSADDGHHQRKKRIKGNGNTTDIILDNRHEMDKFSVRYRNIMLSTEISSQAKAVRVSEVVDDSFSKLWILCRHVALIMECFSFLGKQKRTENFGSYRSDLCCLLYERIVDIHNFELVLRVLETYEVAAIICRLGWLNFFNPMKPEGTIQLNLGRYEERMIAKMLCVLAITEPGSNWTQYQFRWKAEDECVPGWELTEGWVKQDGKDEGMPNRGILTVYYYSGDGQKLKGCKPLVSLRKALMFCTLISETDVRLEEDWGQQLSKAQRQEKYEKGAAYMVNYPGPFQKFLMVDNGRY